ncbi:hypothetical protein CTI18_01585 [Prevotella intermedia]|uniref:Uncharacterized protein n=1 Tax=Prevotella intermedia TaxID=28131 RepID=A0A2G8I9E0_PREIN|nr:hypothetical protein CTI18_01585 [Prevotella intermedia]
MATKKFQTFTRPLGSLDDAEGKIVLRDFDVEALRKSMKDIIRHAKKALKEMDTEIPSTIKVCICYECISDALEDFESSFFRHNFSPVE